MFERVKQLRRMVFGHVRGTQWFFLAPGQRKMWRKVGDGSSSSVVTAPLLWIGRNFPEAPPALWIKSGTSGEEERVTGKGDKGGDHLMLELMERPTPYYSGSALWMATVMDWHLTGNAYWLKIRDTAGRPYELWWTPSALIKPVGDEDTFIDHYEYRPSTDAIRVDSSDVVHFRYSMDPADPRRGKSPLSALLQEVFTDQEASDFTASLLGNMGVPGMVVSPKKGYETLPSPDDVKATKDYLKEAYTGDRRGEPMVMSGPTDVAQFGFSPQQLTLRELRRIPEERVTAVLGVPAIVAGLGAGLDRSTFANFAEAREAAYQDNIIPAQRLLAEEVRFQLLPDFQPDDFRAYRFGFDLSSVRVLQEDRSDLVTRLDVGVRGGWVRVSEARRALDLEVEDTDEVYLRASTVMEQPVGEAQLPPTPPAPPPGEPPPEEPPPEPATARSNGHSAKRSVAAVKAARFQVNLVNALKRDEYALVDQFSGELESYFKALGVTCAEEYMRVMSLAPTRARGGVLVKDQVDAQTVATMIVNDIKKEMQKVLAKLGKEHVARVIKQTLDSINLTTGIGVGVSDEAQKKILESAGKRMGLVDIEQSARDSIFNAINEGNQAGAGPIDIARNIRSSVPAGRFVNAGPAYRAQLIARTETNWAQNVSSIAAYRESDAVTSVIAMDGSMDAECAERDGTEFTFDDAEVEMGNEHPNGTLCFAPVVSKDITFPETADVPPITEAEARGDSAKVSGDEFQKLAAQGRTRLQEMSDNSSPVNLGDWSKLKNDAYQTVQESWGGVTVDAHTGEIVGPGTEKFALSVKPPNMLSVSLPENVSQEDFDKGMEYAKQRFGSELEKENRALGIFHDDENHTIDIDPVVLLDSRSEVDTIGAYTHAVGGAYSFKDGNGYWPPHVGAKARSVVPIGPWREIRGIVHMIENARNAT